MLISICPGTSDIFSTYQEHDNLNTVLLTPRKPSTTPDTSAWTEIDKLQLLEKLFKSGISQRDFKTGIAHKSANIHVESSAPVDHKGVKIDSVAGEEMFRDLNVIQSKPPPQIQKVSVMKDQNVKTKPVTKEVVKAKHEHGTVGPVPMQAKILQKVQEILQMVTSQEQVVTEQQSGTQMTYFRTNIPHV